MDFNKYIQNIGNGRYACTLCDYSQAGMKHVRNHIESKHFPNTFTYECPLCGKQFGTNNSFLNHKKTCSWNIEFNANKVFF